MAESQINVQIEHKLKVPLDEGWFRGTAQKALEAEGTTTSVEMGLVITDSETVQQLNKTYRGKDEPTDVLAFHMFPRAEQEQKPSFVAPPDGTRHLGEVVISYPQAVQQAREQGHSIERELALLTVHGVLHLLGWNHEQPKTGRLMRARENEILSKLNSVRSEE